ncbi:hypothetical protein FM101_08445 [Arthrobacter rhombi]|uniref:Uncharacterized protein n=1 Tax=Arthrobacter rhombi TaxID=71253 RepID=A0A1R4G870_9MICC|nr:hypothetical protein FM101_08445 [Arthrobacter rhombi]
MAQAKGQSGSNQKSTAVVLDKVFLLKSKHVLGGDGWVTALR